jgi:pilus assembly protein TadC
MSIVILGFFLINTLQSPDPFLLEYIILLAIFTVLVPYAFDSLFERRRIEQYERSFAQFLFELADALRGGIDPMRAIVELSTTHTGILKKHLRQAADNIKIGRPFDEVMEGLVKPIKSDLIHRYATLMAETSKVGGETSLVIYRVAKDMDDFIKINQERRRQLSAQTFVIYIAFAVLLIIIYQLITLFPSMTGFNFSLLSTTSLSQFQNTQSNPFQISEELLKRRFFHMMLINSIGTGTLIGAFIDGKIKYGLIHSIVLTLVTLTFFVLLIL